MDDVVVQDDGFRLIGNVAPSVVFESGTSGGVAIGNTNSTISGDGGFSEAGNS